MRPKITSLLLIIVDYISSLFAWALFFIYRKIYTENYGQYGMQDALTDERFILGTTLIPIFWVVLYALNGMYASVYRKSRLKELILCFWMVLLGVIILFFTLILDDFLVDYSAYYYSFLSLFTLQFTLNYLPKFVVGSIIAYKVHRRIIGFNTLVIGCNEKAAGLIKRLNEAKKSAGYRIIGFISLSDNPVYYEDMCKETTYLGKITQLKKIILQKQIQEVIIAVNAKNIPFIHHQISEIYDEQIHFKVVPDQSSILSGQVKMNSILHEALIELNLGRMSVKQKSFKRLFDVVVSCLVLIVFAPLYLSVALAVKLSSKGPVFFTQERVGFRGVPFNIIKFRSMFVDAEKNGPALSKDNDTRITPVGKFLRKTRLDELPQFYNVLKGEMSVVGPRPERQYFIDLIIQKAPEYHYINRLKPGITSWGQVKYGYAENVEQMVERLQFDLIYLENTSFLVDLKIIIHTILVVFQGRGK